ncbi:MAG: ATP-binding protein, partial [Ignavibacteria bacterium]|nr:ATP-binding protein [Ignavibacteria bacterium]
MNENINQIKEYLQQVVKQEFLPHLFSKIDSHKHYFSELSELIGEYSNLFDTLSNENEYNTIEGVIELNKKILVKLESGIQVADSESLLSNLELFDNSINNFFAETEKTRKETQAKERFYFQQGDNLYLRILKFFKRNLYKLSLIPLRIKNIYLKLFKKPTKEIRYWNHIIPLRNLLSIYIKSSLYFGLSELYRKTLSAQILSLLALKKYYDQAEKNFREKHINLSQPNVETSEFETISFQYLETINSLDDLKDEFNKKSDEVIAKIVADYSDAYVKAGTIELTGRKLSTQKVLNSEKEFAQLYNKIHKGWNNTLFALTDDWRMDYELYKTRYDLIFEFIKTSSVVTEKLNKNVKPSITSISKAISDVKQQFSNLIQSNSDIDGYLTESRYNLQSTLTETLIPQTIDSLLKQELLDHLDKLEDIVERSISQMSDKRALVKTDLYDKEIKDSEISYISLRDMLSFSSLPEFKAFVLKTKADQSLKIQKIQNDLLEIDQICDFSLDSAQIMLQEKKGDAAEVKKVVDEGLDRAIKKIGDIDNQLLNLINSFAQKTKESLDDLNNDLIKLTFTESIYELRLTITKDRAIQKSREVKKETVQKVKNVLPHLLLYLKESYNRSTKLYSKTRKLIGLEKTVTTIKGEVSNFLAETGEAINKLPYVYQRLFVVEPIGDERFFFGREEELEKLSKAFGNWSAGKFSPTIIYGEKGSGATSLINVFIKKNRFNNELTRVSVKNFVQSREDFLNLFSSGLQNFVVSDLKGLTGILNDKTSGKKIIILENLQHLFLRKINGFENLKLLFELMSETNDNVFWITTCTVYCYRYLQKTISIADYFANEVELGELSDKQIIDIVLKRHRVSGYDIYFEASDNFRSNKKFQKISESEKQIQLGKTYFSLLNK